jgi:hypothetical protein
MYLLLLVFGGLLTAVGIVLVASGVSIHDHAFDATMVTPGVVAAVGGLLLIGLGLALRVLQRIERALALRRAPRAARSGEPTEPSIAAEQAIEPARIPLVQKPAPRPRSASFAPPPPMSAGEQEAEDLPEKIPAVARIEATRLVEETELSPSPGSAPTFPTSVDVAAAEVDKAGAAKRRNGAAPTRIAPRLDMSAHSPVAAERPAGPAFDTLWPKVPRPLRSAQSPSARAAAAPVVEPEQHSEPAVAAPQAVASDMPQVSVLKSGVVDGMAYTLYSDGSIEAQLPQGILRFGSITELRNHIEQSA